MVRKEGFEKGGTVQFGGGGTVQFSHSSGRFRWCWSGGVKAFWAVVGRSGWLKSKHCHRRDTCFSIFMFFTDCRSRKSYTLTVSVSRKFNLRIFECYGLYKP